MRSTVLPPDEDNLVSPSLLDRNDLFLNYQNSFHEAQGNPSSSEVASVTRTGRYSYYPHTAQSPAYPDTTTTTPLGLGYGESARSSQCPILDGMHHSIAGEYLTIGPSSTQILNDRYNLVHASPASFIAGTSPYQQVNLDLNSMKYIFDKEHAVSDGVVPSEVNSPNLLQCCWKECMHLPTFPDNESLLEHIKSEHINSQSLANREHKRSLWQCNWKDCTSALSGKALLVRHVRTIHVEPGAFSCGLCGNTFNRSDNLIGHQRIHRALIT